MALNKNVAGRDPAKRAEKRERQRASGYVPHKKGSRAKSNTHATSPWFEHERRQREKALRRLEKMGQ